MQKPDDVFDRDREWADLVQFVTSDTPGLNIAVVYGRRRQGKSYLLHRLSGAVGGIYHLATEQTSAVSLRRFIDGINGWPRVPGGRVQAADWESALDYAVELMIRERRADGPPPLLVLDEFPYLTEEWQGLPSIVSGLYDRIGPDSGPEPTPLRLVLCGSAISVMSTLLSGTKALRGRALLEMRVRPFRYRDARKYWAIENLESAFLHNALIGGTPGYRRLVPDRTVPESPDGMEQWITQNILRPHVPLFEEATRIIHEDPRVRGSAVYSSVLAVVAAGESSPTKIGGLLSRPAKSITHQLRMLESAGFLDYDHDLIVNRRPVITVSDPILRLQHLITEPYRAELEDDEPEVVWNAVRSTVDAKILGPHFEDMARTWLRVHARNDAGIQVGSVGQTVVSCKQHGIGHEVDVLALEFGARARTAGTGIAFVGEAKCRTRRAGMAELRRLEHICDLLTAAGHDADGATLGLFSMAGFSDELAERARADRRVVLVGLAELYGTG